VLMGMGHNWSLDEVGFTDREHDFARQLFLLIRQKHEGKAAQMLQIAFFPPNGVSNSRTPGPSRPGRQGSSRQLEMEIIELPHTEAIADAVVGTRIASSGPRLHRPALRKLVIPNRCFVRRSPQEPGGTILVDASGSMGDWKQVKQWCETAPFGTIAYYAGNGASKGKLFVYARDGFRAPQIVEPGYGGNTIDGPAMDWLMQQEAPRIMVTDRHFCDAADSYAQIMRLENLEARGEIIVVDYSHKSDDDDGE
jgi:hypothetical protein